MPVIFLNLYAPCLPDLEEGCLEAQGSRGAELGLVSGSPGE